MSRIFGKYAVKNRFVKPPAVLLVVAGVALCGFRNSAAEVSPEDVVLDVGRPTAVKKLAISPDGSRLAVVDDNGRLDILTPADRSSLPLSESGITFVRFSPDGSRIAAGNDSQVSNWEIATGTLLRSAGKPVVPVKDAERKRLNAHSGRISRDLQRAATVHYSEDGKKHVTFHDLKENKVLISVETTRSDFFRYGFGDPFLSDDGKRAALSESRLIRLFDLEAGRELDPVRNVSVHSHVALHPESKLIAAGSQSNLLLWDVSDATKVTRRDGCNMRATAFLPQHLLEFSPNGRHVICSGGRTLTIVEVTSPEDAGSPKVKNLEGLLSIPALSPDGRWMAALSTYHQIIVFDIALGKPVAVFGARWSKKADSEPGASGAYAFSADGKRLAIGTLDGKVILKTFVSTELPQKSIEITSPVSLQGVRDPLTTETLRFSGDGKYLFVQNRKWVAVVDVAQAKTILVPVTTDNPPTPLTALRAVFPPGGNKVTLIGGSVGLRQYELQSGQSEPIGPDEDTIMALESAPDGSVVAAAISGRKGSIVQLLDPSTYKPIGTPLLERNNVDEIEFAFSPDSTQLACYSKRGGIWDVWDLASRRSVPFFRDDNRWDTIAFARDGNLRLLSRKSGKFRMFDLKSGKTGEDVDLQQGHFGIVLRDVAVSPRTNSFATISNEGEVLLKSLDDGSVLQRLPVQADDLLAVAFSPDGLTLAIQSRTDEKAATENDPMKITFFDLAKVNVPKAASDDGNKALSPE